MCCILFLASCAAIILHKRSLRSGFNPLSSYLTGTADREPQISVCSGSSSGGGDGVGEVGEAVGKRGTGLLTPAPPWSRTRISENNGVISRIVLQLRGPMTQLQRNTSVGSSLSLALSSPHSLSPIIHYLPLFLSCSLPLSTLRVCVCFDGAEPWLGCSRGRLTQRSLLLCRDNLPPLPPSSPSPCAFPSLADMQSCCLEMELRPPTSSVLCHLWRFPSLSQLKAPRSLPAPPPHLSTSTDLGFSPGDGWLWGFKPPGINLCSIFLLPPL